MKLKGGTIFWFLNLSLEIFVFEVHLSIRDLRIGSFQQTIPDSNIYLLQQNKYSLSREKRSAQISLIESVLLRSRSA